MNRHGSSLGIRLFWSLLAVALSALAVGGVAAYASHGDLARGSTGTADLSRVGMIVFLTCASLAFALALGGAIVAWRAEGQRPDPGILIFVLGLAIATAAMIPIVAVMPVQPGRNVVPDLLRIPLYLGGGVLLIGLGVMMTPAIRKGIRRRDPAVLVALLLLAGLIVVRIVLRP